MTAIVGVKINGQFVPMNDVEYSISVQHGRNDVRSQPEASSATVTFRGASALDVHLADELIVCAYGGFCRFTGKVTDLQVTHLSSNPPIAVTQVIAMGRLAELGLKLTGQGGYPHETVRARAETMLADGGLNYLNGASDDLEMHQINEDVIQPVLGALQNLSQASGSTLFDTPEGLIAIEAHGERGLTAYAATWNAQTEQWDYYAQTWDSFPTSFASFTIPEDSIEWAPTWTQNLTTLINDVTVSYGNPDNLSFEQAEDTASIALYGRRAYELTSGLRNDTDAALRAGNILTAQANPLWNMGQISVRVGNLAEPDRDIVLALKSGATVTIPNLPEPAPYSAFTGIVEGWAETFTPGQHVITISISDPRYSYQTVTWNGIDITLEWGDVNPGVSWYNVVKADDLIAA